jgi:hypothetical protein
MCQLCKRNIIIMSVVFITSSFINDLCFKTAIIRDKILDCIPMLIKKVGLFINYSISLFEGAK